MCVGRSQSRHAMGGQTVTSRSRHPKTPPSSHSNTQKGQEQTTQHKCTHVDDLPKEPPNGPARDEGGGEEAHREGQGDAECGDEELEDHVHDQGRAHPEGAHLVHGGGTGGGVGWGVDGLGEMALAGYHNPLRNKLRACPSHPPGTYSPSAACPPRATRRRCRGRPPGRSARRKPRP